MSMRGRVKISRVPGFFIRSIYGLRWKVDFKSLRRINLAELLIYALQFCKIDLVGAALQRYENRL